MKKLMLACLTLVALVVAACTPLFAADLLPAHAPAAVSSGNVFTTFLQQSVFPIITALFMGAVSIFLNRLGQKYKVEALTQKNNIVEQLAYQGITKAEELAAKYAGSRAVLSGQDKLSVAVNHILSVMPSVTREQAESMVHALLAQIPGLGASGDTAIERYPMPTAALAIPAVPEPESAPAA
ncbi:hypothetical protein GMLC_14780 [Geomonas limicola]|uniref:Lipoprotein n=1 Tax=Geomonas limicola TaxID=2740186 RepID=A0A6V8N9H3_9BACT|nr:hypothetical protein [Geomonas limicola]GFO67899.1 hypothetical protein GMLC_14780 [Geomonas limicola]